MANYLSDTPRALRLLRVTTTIGQVSRSTGISPSHISRIFNHKRRPSIEMAAKICAHLDVTVDQLLAALNESQASPDPRAA